MQLHKDLKNIPISAQGCVLVIGNFDGVHAGHRALIAQAKEIAQKFKAPVGVLTFEPHPRSFFQPEGEPFRLSSLSAKGRLLEAAGMGHLFVAGFDRDFAALSAHDFIQNILVDALRVKHVVVGVDFAFGKGRSGNVETLRSRNIPITVVDPVKDGSGEIYSSTRIRQFIQKAAFEEAAKALGAPWEVEAEIIHGDKRGRELGYPTANQKIGSYLRMPFGIYAVRVLVEGEEAWRDGAASFGIRPMFQIQEPLLETFIFDYTREIYGKIMRVRPVAFLRPEMKFDGLATLQEQMKQDCLKAKAVLKSSPL